MGRSIEVGLRFDPIGGGQFQQAINGIIEAEKQPIKTLETRKAREDARLKLFQEFKSKISGVEKSLNEISSFKKLRELKVDLGDGSNLVSVTLDKDIAEVGQYQIEISQLAEKSSAITTGVSDPDQPIFGMGYVSLALENGSSVDLYIEEDAASLRGIASLINRHPGSPVRAAIIRDDLPEASNHPWKMILTSRKEGYSNRIDTPDFYFPNSQQDLYVEQENEGENSKISIDQFEIETERNDIKNFLPGVNLHLKQASPEHPFQLTITEDFQKISAKVKTAVEQINQVLQFIYKQNAIDAKSDTSTTFAGDSTLQAIEYKIRNLVHGTFETTESEEEQPIRLNLNQIGIEFERSGLISFKEDRFMHSLEEDFELISQAITGPDGFANALLGIIRSYNQVNEGVLAQKEKGLKSRIKQIDDQIENKSRFIEQRKQNLVNQFSRLESTLGKMQKQQQYLAATLPGAGSSMAQLIGGA